MEKQFLNPDTLPAPRGYTQIVSTPPGRTIYISGQVALNAKGELVGKGDLRAQTVQVYENLKAALDAAGATFAEVVKTTTYVVNYKPEQITILREVRGQYYPHEPPASTLVGVQALVGEDWLVEIEAVAVLL